MKITLIRAQNYQRLKFAELPMPTRGVVHVTGPNGAGKTSLLSAVFAAFGSAKAAPEIPIRQGEKSAEVRIETDEVDVIRKFGVSAKGEPTTTLIVEKDGARYQSPQRLLDQFWSPIAFDPLAFSRLDDGAQYDQLRALVKLDVDPDDLENRNRRDYELRTEVNRDAARLRGQASGIAYPDGLPESEIDVGELGRRLQEASENNAAAEREKSLRERLAQQATDHRVRADALLAEIEPALAEMRVTLAARLTQIDEDIADLERRLAELRHRRNEFEAGAQAGQDAKRRALEQEAAEHSAKAAELEKALRERGVALAEPIDLQELVARIEEARRINGFIEDRKRRETLEAEAKALEDRSAALTEQMAERTQQIRDAIEKAEMPIAGLSFAEGRVLYNNVPLRQASSAEQLRVSIAIGMALNPRLRFMVIRDGVFLDDDSLAAVSQMAVDNDYQMLIESIDPDGKVGIVMEEGEVAEVLTEETAAATKRPPRRRKAEGEEAKLL